MAAKRVHGPAHLTNVTATKYTVPTGMRFIMRHIRLSNPGAAIDITGSVGADAAATRFMDGWPMPADSVEDIYPYIPVEAGEIIAMHASVTNQVTVTISGDLEAV